MKVCFIFLHPFSCSLGSTVRVRELTISLTKFGVESYIFTPYEKTHNLSEGVTVIGIGGAIQKLGLASYFYQLSRLAYYNKFFIGHLMTENTFQTKFAKNLAKIIAGFIKKFKIDLIQAEQDFALPVAINVQKLTGLPLLLDLHNITPEELVAANVIEKNSNCFNNLQKNLQNSFQKTDTIAVVSNEMKNYVIETYDVSAKNVILVLPGSKLRDIPEKNALDGSKVVYSGLVSYREHVDLFVRSISKVVKTFPDTKFFMTQKGDSFREMKKLASTLNIHPVYFWFPNSRDFYSFLSSCHIGILPSSNDLARKMGTPVKLFDYLAAGIPVVSNNIDSWTNIIREERVGVVTDDNPMDFASGILRLLSDDELRESCMKRGINLIKDKYNWDNSAKSLIHAYKNLI